VVDDDILGVGVWHEEFVVELNWAIEGIADGVLHIDQSMGHLAVLGRCVVWGDDDVELVGLATEVTLGEHVPVWEAVVVVVLVDLELISAVGGGEDLLVELLVGGAVVGEVVAVVGVALDDVLSGGEAVVEPVEEEEVHAVVVHVDFAAELVVFWTDEDLDESLDWFVGLNLDLVVEGLVVQAVLTGADLELFVGEFLLVDGDGVAQVGVVGIEESDETVDLDVLNLDSIEVKFLLLVCALVVLVLVEVEHDPLVHLPEHGVAEGGFKVFQCGWDDLVLVQWEVRVAEEVAGEDLEVSVEMAVDGLWVAFDHVAELFKTILVEEVYLLAFMVVDVSHIDGITETPLVVLDEGVAVGVVSEVRVALLSMDSIVVQASVVWPGWEVQSVGVGEGWGVSSLNWVLVLEVRDLTEVVGETFQVVTGQALLVEVVELFAAETSFVGNFVFGHPEWSVHMEVVVVGIDVDIFGEVGHGLFWMDVHVPAGVVGVDGVSLVVGILDLMLVLVGSPVVLFVLLGLVDDFVAEEVVGEDFVNWRQDDVLAMLAVDDGNGQGVDEHALVDVLAGPVGHMVEGVVILGIIEGPEESDGLLHMLWVEHGEDLSLGKDIMLVEVEELLRVFRLGPLVPVSLEFEFFGVLVQLLVVAGLVDVVEKVQNVFLLLQVSLVSNFVVLLLDWNC